MDSQTDIQQVGLKYSSARQVSIGPPVYGWYAVAAEHAPTLATWKLSVEAYCIQMGAERGPGSCASRRPCGMRRIVR